MNIFYVCSAKLCFITLLCAHTHSRTHAHTLCTQTHTHTHAGVTYKTIVYSGIKWWSSTVKCTPVTPQESWILVSAKSQFERWTKVGQWLICSILSYSNIGIVPCNDECVGCIVHREEICDSFYTNCHHCVIYSSELIRLSLLSDYLQHLNNLILKIWLRRWKWHRGTECQLCHNEREKLP